MTILCTPDRDVQPYSIVPTALDREWAAQTAPGAYEHNQCDEPTPDDVLDLDTPPRRYTVHVNCPEATDGGYVVWDSAEGKPVKFVRWFADAETLAEDMNITAHYGDQGDWWDTLPAGEDLDARWSLTLAGGRRSAMRVGPEEEARMHGGF